MKNVWPMRLFVLAVSLMLLFSTAITGLAADKPATRGQLADILKNLNKAVMEGDLATFDQLTVAPRPEMKMSSKEFTRAKDRMMELFPPLSAIDPVKFALGKKESLVVVRFGLDEKDAIQLRAYRFVHTKEGWKLLLKFTSKIIDAKDPATDEAAIAKELETTPDFQLAEAKETKKRPDMPVPTTKGLKNKAGAGFLSVADQVYKFNHSVAYKTKSGQDEMTVVIVSDSPIDRNDLKSKVKKLGTWTGFKNHVMISFDRDAKPVSLSFWVKKDSFSLNAPGFDLKSDVGIKANQVTGQVMMKAPNTQFGTDYYFEVAFNTDVITP